MNRSPAENRIPFNDVVELLTTVLRRKGFETERARACARIFAENSLDGVASHGLNRFPRFVEYIDKGFVIPEAVPTTLNAVGSIEQWDGRCGPGPLNALAATKRAMSLAETQGLGCVAMANTNHWMRGGYYGRVAAAAGFVFIGWSNTTANMPAWGARDARLGNNPLVIAVPNGTDPVVLDMAMTQYSYGTLERKQLRGESLPYVGGYDTAGELTSDPSSIIESQRALPVGYWKGSGLALLLDLVAAILSGGKSTQEVSTQPAEYAVSQVYLAFDCTKLSKQRSIDAAVQSIIDHVRSSIPAHEGEDVLLPGDRVRRTRSENLEKGIPVDAVVWDLIRSIG